jgi:UDP-3-O-[3-hydroxymyristoyl] N-acetylglucosamine deacetylase
VGVGVHSGCRVSLTLRPAEPGTGIVFRRTDLGLDFPARFDRVVDTRLCTVLGAAGHPGSRLGTVEHLMAALAGCGNDNAIAEIDGPELPIVDGSAAPLVFLIDCAGSIEQDAPRREIEILRTIRVADGEAFAELRPGGPGFGMAMSIDFHAAVIGRQALTLRLTPDSFRHEIADARTFTDAADIEHLRKAGLAQGGSLANAVVVDAARVLNPGGLRRPDEFVRHNLLDAVGDLALAGAPLRGRFVAHRSGHTLNNRLLRALFADASAWRMVGDVVPAPSTALSAAA